MPAGLISVDIEARLSKLEEGVGRANKNLDGFGKNIERVSARAKSALTGLAAGFAATFSVAAFAGMTREILANAEALQDLSDATGSSVEALSRLNNITKIGGGNFEEIKGAIERLAAGLAGVEEGGSKTADALRFLKIEAKDPAQALEEIAIKLNKFSDGASKAAIAKDLFGRAGVGFLATLKDIANNGGVAATVTTKQAEEATKLAEALRKLQVQSTGLSNAILSDVVPVLNTVLGKFQDGIREAGGFQTALIAFTRMNPFQTNEENLERLRKQLADAEAARYDEGSFSKFFNELTGKSWDKTINGLKAAINLIERAEAQSKFHRSGLPLLMPDKPQLGYTGGKTGGSPAAKVDEFAKAIERVSKLAAEAELELQGMFSTQEITGAQKALAALTSSDEWQKFTQPQRDALQARYQMIDAVQRETSAWKTKREETEKEIQALKQIDEAQARAVQAFTGNLGQYAEENSAISRSIALIGQDDTARQKFNETLRYEALVKEALAAQDYKGLAILDEQYQKRLKLIDVIDAQTKKLEEVQKFTDIGAQSFSNFLQDLTRGKPLDALNKLGEELTGRITSVVSDSLSKKLFSKDGALGGFGKFFSDLLGDENGATGAVALTGSASALNLSAAALSAAAAKLAASSGFSMSGDLFDSLGTRFLPGVTDMVPPEFGIPAFASGTDYVPRTGLALVHRGERITPAAHNRRDSSARSRPNVTINLSVPARADTQTIRQAAKQGWRAGSGSARRG